MSKTGRPALFNGERMVHVTVRIPAWLHAQCKTHGNVSEVMRKALEKYLT